jgi:hypothetical protein
VLKKREAQGGQEAMIEETPVFTRPAPPKLITTVSNALIAQLLRSPLHGLVSKSCVLLSFKGRKSGNSYTFPVGYFQQEENEIEVIPLHNWWRNLRGNVPVTVWLKGRHYSAVAEVYQGDEATVNELQRLVQGSSALLRICQVERDAQGQPKVESVRRAARSLVLIRLRLLSLI